MRYVLMILLIIALVVLVIIAADMAKRSSKRKIKKNLDKIFSDLENEYEDFIRQRINMQIIENDNLNLDTVTLTQEARTILQPYLEAILGLVNAFKINEPIDTKHEIKYFKNLYFLTNKFLQQKLPLTSFEKDELETAMNDAIRADVQKRLLQLKSGF